mgnify:CR=1 FL=1
MSLDEVLKQFNLKNVIIEQIDSGLLLREEKTGPRILYVEPTLKCNLNCIMCFRRGIKEPFGDMSPETFDRILANARECNVEFIWFGGWGEPLVHPLIFDFIEKTKNAGIGVGINTNGTLLTPEVTEKIIELGVDHIVVSSDAATHETYAKIRGEKLTTVLEALDYILRLQKKIGLSKPRISFLFTSMINNITELPNLLYTAKKHGATTVIVSNVIPTCEEMVNYTVYTNHKIADTLSEVIRKVSIAIFDIGIRVILPKFDLRTERRCLFIENSSATITWDGKVVPCHNFIHSYTSYIYGFKKEIKQVSFGNINEEKLSDIWWKRDYLIFRWKVRHFSFPSCIDCELKDYCSWRSTNEMDCWGNSPSCAECLYGRGIVQCMV